MESSKSRLLLVKIKCSMNVTRQENGRGGICKLKRLEESPKIEAPYRFPFYLLSH